MSLDLKEYHCDTFQLRMQFDTGEMNVEAFLSALAERGISTEADSDGVRDLELVFGSDDPSDDRCHAHANIRIWKDDSGRVVLSYHEGKTSNGIDPPPNVEEAPKWLGNFFSDKSLTTHVHVNYTFNQSYRPTVTLHFPLVTSEKELAGSIVTGLAFTLPTEPKTTAIVQSGATDEIHLFLRKTVQIQLKDFVLAAELQKLSSLVNVLIKKADK
ncbi:MAG TPA: hypothetical protein VJV03_15050 [Pyrinomonadaceae bacterium]|nr:hypothetical protein [Pyrinomonadaceae bacterium]